MEFEQIVKRQDWLDEEHRKTASSLDSASEKLETLINENKTLRKKIKEITNDMLRFSSAASRIEEYEKALTHHRKEISTYVNGVEKKRDAAQSEIDKRYRLEFDEINKVLVEFRKTKTSVTDLKKELKIFKEDDIRRIQAASDSQTKMESMLRRGEEIQRSLKATDEAHRKDEKRTSDLAGEISSIRKRLDEIRDKNNTTSDGLRRIEIRMNEISSGETERKQSQISFIENQARLQVERDHIWQGWQDRFDFLSKQTESIDQQLQNWDSAQRMIRRAQETYEDITTKFERRINEITEIQRLGEDRFRQEWVSSKADDQKRWTSFTLSQEEARKDIKTEISKLKDRLTTVEDLAQNIQDVIQQSRDADEQMLQAILAQIHELLSTYERIKGNA